MEVYFRCSATELHKINKGHKSQTLTPFCNHFSLRPVESVVKDMLFWREK